MILPSRSASTVGEARRWRSVCETVVSAMPVAAARSETLIGPAAWMQVSRVRRVGSANSATYGWAFAKPVRKVYYNLVITGLSIGAAFIIGTIEILGVLTTEVHLRGAFWRSMASFDINVAGFCIAGLFVVVWVVALAYWRWGKVEARWRAPVAAGGDRAKVTGATDA